MGSGKTALLHALERGIFAKTITSTAPNTRAFVPAGFAPSAAAAAKNWQFVDVPGHGSFGLAVTAALPETRAVVFAVDRTDEASWPLAAARIYALCTAPALAKAAVPIVIYASKVRLMTKLHNSEFSH